MEIWNMITDWFSQNIVPLLTTTNLVAILTVIFNLFRQKKVITESTVSGKELNQSLKETKELSKTLSAQSEEIAELKAQNGELNDLISQLLFKCNSMLDIQQIVYNASASLSKDTRGSINNIITNAKFATSNARADILKEMEDLQKKTELLQKEQEQKTKKIKRLVQASNDEVKGLINF